MKNKWYWILPVAALLAIALVALPGPAAQELAARKVIRAELLAAIEQEVARERELAQGATGFWFSDDDDRGWLGVSISEVTADKAKELKLPAERGVLLTDVEADSPAAKAGLK